MESVLTAKASTTRDIWDWTVLIVTLVATYSIVLILSNLINSHIREG